MQKKVGTEAQEYSAKCPCEELWTVTDCMGFETKIFYADLIGLVNLPNYLEPHSNKTKRQHANGNVSTLTSLLTVIVPTRWYLAVYHVCAIDKGGRYREATFCCNALAIWNIFHNISEKQPLLVVSRSSPATENYFTLHYGFHISTTLVLLVVVSTIHVF